MKKITQTKTLILLSLVCLVLTSCTKQTKVQYYCTYQQMYKDDGLSLLNDSTIIYGSGGFFTTKDTSYSIGQNIWVTKSPKGVHIYGIEDPFKEKDGIYIAWDYQTGSWCRAYRARIDFKKVYEIYE